MTSSSPHTTNPLPATIGRYLVVPSLTVDKEGRRTWSLTVDKEGCRTWSYQRNGQLQDPEDGSPALVVCRPDETVEYSTHYTDGVPNDPANGSPTTVQYRPDGTVSYYSHQRYGRFQDPADDCAAVVAYTPEGKVWYKLHYTDGMANDPPDGRPAQVWYHPNGLIERYSHYRNDRLQDPEDGSPAVVCYSLVGNRTFVRHYHDGEIQDPPDGGAAVVYYTPEGVTVRCEHWEHGKLVLVVGKAWGPPAIPNNLPFPPEPEEEVEEVVSVLPEDPQSEPQPEPESEAVVDPEPVVEDPTALAAQAAADFLEALPPGPTSPKPKQLYRCSHCHERKPRDAFYGVTSRSSWCGDCRREKTRASSYVSAAETLGLLTVNEMAEQMGVPRHVMYRYVKSGEIKAFKMGRMLMVPRAEFEEFVARHKRQGRPVGIRSPHWIGTPLNPRPTGS